MEYLLKNTEDTKEKMYLINYFLEQFKGTLYRQTMFAEFEKITHEMAAKKEPLTAEVLCDIYYKLNQQYFGEGLVLMIPRKGAEVAEITEKNLRDVLEVRCALEELAVQLACDRMDEEGVRELRAAAETFESILNSDDITQIAQADVAFHDIIYAATDNRRLIQLLNNLREQMYRYRIEYLKKKECYPQLLNEHQTIIDAIAGHDKELATKFTSQHIKNQAETVVGTIREKEENA